MEIPVSIERDAWMEDAACRFEETKTFFPQNGVGVEMAKKICSVCVVQQTCLEYAIDHRIDHGVWGGASERERSRIIKKRRLA